MTEESPAPMPVREREPVQHRVALLRAELEAQRDKARKAEIQFLIGRLLETEVGNDALAVKEYLAAFNVDPTFRLPLFAMVDIFERRRSYANLGRLYGAEAKSAREPAARASALIDAGALLEDHFDQPGEAREQFEEAFGAAPHHLPAALFLERHARRAGDLARTETVVSARATHTRDPVMRALLLVELAWEREAAGELEEAFELCRRAVDEGAARWRTLEQMERIAIAHGRTAEWIQAVEGRAQLAAAHADGSDTGASSGVFSIERFPTLEAAKEIAASLYYEGARLRVVFHADTDGAMESLLRGLELKPDDVLLLEETMLVHELRGDLESAGRIAQRLAALPELGQAAAPIQFRLAEAAEARGDSEEARAALLRCLELAPGSPMATSLYDDLMLDQGRHAERVAELERRAESGEPADRMLALWRAAQICAERLHDLDRARALYLVAAELGSRKAAILRELSGAASRAGRYDIVEGAIETLLAEEIDAEERSSLLRELYVISRDYLGSPEKARGVLSRALASEPAASWAPDAARVFAARTQNLELLASAHESLAARATEDETAAAHLCAAGRAALASKNEERAIALLRAAEARVPGHRYAIGLLEELLKRRGQGEAVVELLRNAANAQAPGRAELNFLLAGAAAEATGDVGLAGRTYEDAADRDPTSTAPLFALKRLAERSSDTALLLRAREALSEREIAQGEPGPETFEVAEHYDVLSQKAELAETPYRRALANEQAGPSAAIGLYALPGARIDRAARIEAVERLVESAREADSIPLLRALAFESLVDGFDAERGKRAAGTVFDREPNDLLCALGTVFSSAEAGDEAQGRHADGWLALAQGTTDTDASAELALVGLRAKLIASGADGIDEAFLIAQEVAATTPESFAAGVALDETLSAGDDDEARVEALTARVEHGGKVAEGALRAELGRTLLAAGRTGEALVLLKQVVSQDATDLASWESIRVAARAERRFEDVVRACDELAKALPECDLKAQLLEEAAAAAMDELGDATGAQERLERVLAYDVRRPVAFGRLEDLYSERAESSALADLVGKRIENTEEPEELVKLYYQQARLLRGEKDLEGALRSLENLLMLDETHVGGLALQVECYVALENWQEAVETLRRLSEADVPPAQRRLALLGAADFLEKRLGDSRGAMREIRKIVDLGLGDASLLRRIADIAERAGDFGEAATALEQAASESTGYERTRFLTRAGIVIRDRMGEPDRAAHVLRTALAEAPTDMDAAEELALLYGDPRQVLELSQSFETAVRIELAPNPANPDVLRKLVRAAMMRGDRELERLALAALFTLGGANDDERMRLESLRTVPAFGPALSERARRELRAPQASGAANELAKLLAPSVASLYRIEPATAGVGKNELVGPKTQHPARAEIARLGATFGMPAADLYVGGPDPNALALAFGKKAPAWIVGTMVAVPFSAIDRFRFGRLAASFTEGTLPYQSLPPADAATLLFAGAQLSEVALPRAAGRPGIDEARKALDKHLPRKTRKSIADLARTLPDGGASFDGWAFATQETAARAGLLLASDLAAAHVATSVSDPNEWASGPFGRALLEFWLSPSFLAIRRELGFDR
jgi:hypothetical protein